MTAKLTLQQYNTIKSIWENNNQGVTLDQFVLATCAFKDLIYDPIIHEIPLEPHISPHNELKDEKGINTQLHEHKYIERVFNQDTKEIYNRCECGKVKK